MSYINHANMGDYRVAIQQFESGETAVPDVTIIRFVRQPSMVLAEPGAEPERLVDPRLDALAGTKERQESSLTPRSTRLVTFG